MNKHTTMEIIPRKLNLTFDAVAKSKKVNFIINNPLMTAFIATLSATFPEGEKQFIATVRHYADQIKDEQLKIEIKQFIKQEAYHAIEHNTFNKRFDELGWKVYDVENIMKKWVVRDKRVKTHAEQLATTVAMEHLTATFAHWMMNREDLYERFGAEIGDILIWHSIEETEHKAVAFDVFEQCVGDRKLLHKALSFNYAVFNFIVHINSFLLVLRTKQLPRWKHIKEFYQIIHGKNGLYKSIRGEIKDFYRDDFHPWDHDNKILAERWIQKLNLASSNEVQPSSD